MESRATNTLEMGRTCNHEDLNALVVYIQELEISLKKKEQRIATLETEVSAMKDDVNVDGPIFQAKSLDEAVTQRALADRSRPSEPSTPNQVSDESGDVEPTSEESDLIHSLSLITKVSSLENDEDSTQHTEDGRWYIPFDGSFDEDLVAKSLSGKGVGHENALKQIGFIPICKEDHDHHSCGTEVTPLRPVTRRSHGDYSPFTRVGRRGLSSEMENIRPKREGAVGIRALRSIR
mmetsp:Transcript_6196/g.15419  ORF Transcript_6196/g.15419 Transcript_6196/m.15419 type:complete len:235 (-) Transcript_6196:89-793(-)